MNESFEHNVIQLLAAVPPGKVTTYGDLAKAAGFKTYSRQVARVLKQLPRDSKLPWFRVINSQGKISLPAGSDAFYLQKKHLMDEGVTVIGDKISLKTFRYDFGL